MSLASDATLSTTDVPAQRAGTRRRVVIACVAFAVAATLVAGRTLRNLNVAGQPTLPRYGMQDFRDAIYYPVVSLLDGNNPYDVALYRGTYPVVCKFPLYAPLTLAVHLPLGFLSQLHAEQVFLALNILLTLALAAVTLRVAGAGVAAASVVGLATAILLSHPGQMVVFLGQSTIYVVIGVYLALGFARSRPWLAAAGLALACLKPTFGAPVAFLMLWRGDVGAVVRGAAIAALASLPVAAAVAGAARGVIPFLVSLRDNYQQWDQSRFINIHEAVHRVDTFVLAGRLLGHQLSTAGDLLITLVIFGVAVWCIRRLARADGDAARALSSSVICAATLAGAYHQAYDAVVLALPAVVVATGRPFAAGRPGAMADGFGRGLRWLLLASIGVVALNYVATYAVIDRLGIRGGWWVAVTSASAIAVLATFALLAALALRFRVPAHDSRARASR